MDLRLHFDLHYYRLRTKEELELLLSRERRILEEFFNREIRVFSFHIVATTAAEFTEFQYSGLINAYASYFKTSVPYCSDSNGYWRYRRLEDVLATTSDSCLQVLTHPELWQDNTMSPKERVYRCIDGRAEKTKRWYEETLRAYGRENVDW